LFLTERDCVADQCECRLGLRREAKRHRFRACGTDGLFGDYRAFESAVAAALCQRSPKALVGSRGGKARDFPHGFSLSRYNKLSFDGLTSPFDFASVSACPNTCLLPRC